MLLLRQAGAFLVLVVVLLLVLFAAAPRVDGRPVRPGLRVTEAVRLVGAPRARPGDLLDVTGRVLKPGGGEQPRLFLAGALVPADYVLRWRDRIQVRPGRDLREPAMDVVTCSRTASGGVIVARHVEGKVSGRQAAVERMAIAAPKRVRIALTFDDGPNPVWTPQVLDVLAKYRAKASFFVLGQCAVRWPELVRRQVAEGHEICLHSYSHARFTQLPASRVTLELARNLRALSDLAVGPIRWFRPPYGVVNARVREQVAAMGYRTVLWDVDTRDWRRPPAEVIAARILAGAHDGAVILMHDGGGDRSRTVAALALALPRLKARGVEMLTLSQVRRFAPAPPSEVVVAEAHGQTSFSVTTVKVLVDGRLVEPRPLAARHEGQLLVAARPVLAALGMPASWDEAAQALCVETPRGQAILRAGSRRFTLADRDLLLSAPVFRFEGQVLAPASLLAKLTNTILTVSPDGTTARFDTVSRPFSPEPPQRGAGTSFRPAWVVPAYAAIAHEMH
ncbi:MAG: polysaccharide deacetylase family protein [Armatimonadetes bacterium]|nr:polysaccharide deacetylase family protein [Armatimonadota bacterium]